MSKFARSFAAVGARKSLIEPFLIDRHSFGREEDRQPAVGDLRRERDILGADGGKIDGNARTQRMDDQLERFAEARDLRCTGIS